MSAGSADVAEFTAWQAPPPYVAHIGPYLRHRSEAGRLSWRTAPHHDNGTGVVHGGYLTGLAHYSALDAAQALSDGRRGQLISLHVDFMAPAEPGAVLEARATAIPAESGRIGSQGMVRTGERPLLAFSGLVSPEVRKVPAGPSPTTRIPAGYAELDSDRPQQAFVGPYLVKDGDSQVVAVQVQAHHLDEGGGADAGILMMLADSSFGIVNFKPEPGITATTVTMSSNFFHSAALGDIVDSHSSLLRETRSLLFLDATLSVRGQPIAYCTGIMKKVPRKTT